LFYRYIYRGQVIFGHRVFSGSSSATLWFSGLNRFLGNFRSK
jgi:hypothetical protein